MKRWGHVLHGDSPGWRWIENSPEMSGLRCRVCNTYPDEVIFGYLPGGTHLADILDSVRLLRIVTANDGFTVFGRQTLRLLLESGASEDLFRSVGADVFTFDLRTMPVAPAARADMSRARACGECGRFTPVWRSTSVDAPIVLADAPVKTVVRSAEIFGLADLRSPEIYVSDAEYARFELPRHAYDVVISSP